MNAPLCFTAGSIQAKWHYSTFRLAMSTKRPSSIPVILLHRYEGQTVEGMAHGAALADQKAADISLDIIMSLTHD